MREVATTFGADVHMTGETHRSGTERIAQVVRERGESGDQTIVNVQGDEPLIPAELIAQAARLLEETSEVEVATLCEAIDDAVDLFRPRGGQGGA